MATFEIDMSSCPCCVEACCTEIPVGFSGSLADITGCSCLNGETATGGSVDGTTFTGSTAATLCGFQRQLDFSGYCNGTTVNDYVINWNFSDADDPNCNGQTGTSNVVTDPGYEPSCNPFSMYFDITVDASCCNGTPGGTTTFRLHVYS